ncbi:MAG: hypothetical protein ABIH03_07615 [Pseudomonadota bacterium]
MSNELTIAASMSYNKNGKRRTLSVSGQQVDVTGDGYIDNSQDVGFAAHEALVLGEVATPGWASFKNCDDTNYVQIGIDDGGTFEPFVKLLAGEETGPMRLAGAPYAQANTGAVILSYIIVEA